MHKIAASFSGGSRAKEASKDGSNVDEFGAGHRDRAGNSSKSYPGPARNNLNDGRPPIPEDPRRRDSRAANSSSHPHSSSHSPNPSSSSPALRQAQSHSPTTALHSLPAIAELLNSHKVYRAGYLWRLDNDPSASTKQSGPGHASSAAAAASEPTAFVKYFMRLEDCILCLWPDEGLKQAQAQGTTIHPSSMNITEGFVALASSKPEWEERAHRHNSPTPFNFVLNTAGNNSIIFGCETEEDLRRWMNAIRLAVWERSRVELMHTTARLGIREEQQGSPIRSALYMRHGGAKIGRAEGYFDIRLPGDTEWKRVYGVLTDPQVYDASKSDSMTSPKPAQAPPPAASISSKKEKRKSFLGLLSGSGSKHDLAKESAPTVGRMSLESDSSPVSYQHNPQLEDQAVGPTFAIFGILSGGGTSGDPSSPNARQSDFSSSTSSTSSASGIPLKLTRRPIIIVRDVYSAYAVWPESEGLVPHSKLFKMEGRLFYDEQEIAAYAAAPGTVSGKGPMSVFMEAMRRENRDRGKVEHQNTLLCMHAGSGREPVGPGNAVKSAYPGDVGSETLSWCLALYDAFRLHGRPEKLIYSPTHPFSPYFCQPIGPTRGRLYFEMDLTEDLPNTDDNRPREINNQYMRILFERMVQAGAIPPSPVPRPFLSPAMRSSPRLPPQQRNFTPPNIRERDGRSASPRMHVKEGSAGDSSLPAIPVITTDKDGRPHLPASQRLTSSGPQSRERSPLLDTGSFENNPQTARLSPSLGTSGSPRRPSDSSARYAGSSLSSQQPEAALDDSFSQDIAQAMLRSESRQAEQMADPQVTPRAMESPHPGTLVPGGSGRNSRRTSLNDVHRSEEPYNSNSNDEYSSSTRNHGDVNIHPDARHLAVSSSASGQPSNNNSALVREDTTASHYNSTPSRSLTPSAKSIASATALALPGSYVSETPQQTPALDQSGPERKLESIDSTLEGIRNASPPGTVAEHQNHVREEPHEESVLTDEAGALFALSLPDNDVPKQHIRKPEPTRHDTQDSLVAAIKQRAGANLAASPISAGGVSNTATRSSTMGTNTPVSGMPSSASEYSQNGNTDIDARRLQAEVRPLIRQGSASSEGKQESSSGHLGQTLQDNEQAKRLSKVSGGSSTVEGQDDYLAGLNYLALTEGTEDTTPAPTRPLRTAAGQSSNNRPAISISTGNKAGVGGFADPGANGNGQFSPSTTSPVPESPTSPDPYGTYAEPQKVSVGATKASNTKKRRPSGPSATPAPPPPMPVQARKAGRKGVPSGRKPARRLGSWSSDEDSSNSDKDEDEDDDDRDDDPQQTNANLPVSAEQVASDRPARERPALLTDDSDRNRDLRASTSSGGSIRRALPQLPGPSTDPYINQNAMSQSPIGEGPHGGDDAQYAQYGQHHSARPSMYGFPGPGSMSMMHPWQMQQHMSQYSPQAGSPQPFSPPYNQSPSPSPHGNFGPGQETMVSSIQQDPNTAAADARAARQAAVAPHGLLQAGLQDKHHRSAAQIEAQAKESGGPLLQMGHKAQAPQGGLMGAIATHEREKKREGGLGATLTERERERRLAETRQREMEQMHHRQSSMFGGTPFNWAGMAGGGGFNPAAGPYGMDPAQMQQQMAMLAAQNAYLQAMAGFNNPAMQNPGFISPFGQPNMYAGSQMGFTPSYLGMPQSQSPQAHSSRGPSPSGAPYGHHQSHPSYGGQGGEQR